MTLAEFKKIIWNFYRKNRRDFPWRNTTNPYHIVVSEIMLQQTQTSRVVEKYKEFLKAFPTWKKLAEAPFSEVLKVWKGLGYNRRAVALHRIAKEVSNMGRKLPKDAQTLKKLPGIGPNTAGSILAFAYNLPTIFIETNIRTVFIHFFFNDKENVNDKEIFPLIEKTLDKKKSREWYYALMDYGNYLKKNDNNLNAKSAHYRKQSTFKGSNREIRSLILHTIAHEKNISKKKITQKLKKETEIIAKNLLVLEKEGFILKKNNLYSIS